MLSKSVYNVSHHQITKEIDQTSPTNRGRLLNWDPSQEAKVDFVEKCPYQVSVEGILKELTQLFLLSKQPGAELDSTDPLNDRGSYYPS